MDLPMHTLPVRSFGVEARNSDGLSRSSWLVSVSPIESGTRIHPAVAGSSESAFAARRLLLRIPRSGTGSACPPASRRSPGLRLLRRWPSLNRRSLKRLHSIPKWPTGCQIGGSRSSSASRSWRGHRGPGRRVRRRCDFLGWVLLVRGDRSAVRGEIAAYAGVRDRGRPSADPRRARGGVGTAVRRGGAGPCARGLVKRGFATPRASSLGRDDPELAQVVVLDVDPPVLEGQRPVQVKPADLAE